MIFFENSFVQDNFEILLVTFLIAFAITLLVTPVIGQLAKTIGAIDLPAAMRKSSDRSTSSRINVDPKLKLGGIAILVGFLGTSLLKNSLSSLSIGIMAGLAILMFMAFLDDRYEVSGKTQLLLQYLAAQIVVIGGISVTQISLFGTVLDFNMFSALIKVEDFAYTFIFPADLLTIFWIVAVINFVNWVGGVDGLNTAVTAIIASTMMMFALSNQNILLATLIAAHVGALVGYFPYNYNPSKIIQGATGDYLNGYMLAVYAILGGTQWSSTFVILALPFIDAFVVLYNRLKEHPRTRRNPLLLLRIADTNHLHHKLMKSGYSRKATLLIESTIVVFICTLALLFSGIRRDFVAFAITIAILVGIFSSISFLQNRHKKRVALNMMTQGKLKEAEVTIKVEDEGDEEKFVY